MGSAPSAANSAGISAARRCGAAASASETLSRPCSRMAATASRTREKSSATVSVTTGCAASLSVSRRMLLPCKTLKAAEQIASWAADRADDLPLVVAGDLNATLDDAELAPLLAAGLRSVLPDDAGPTATAFETEDGRRLDHVLVSHHWEVGSAEVAHRAGTASDHYPVVAELRLR